MTLKKFATQFALTLSLVAGTTTTAVAQTATSTLHGTVLDPSGALIPDAQITITGTDGLAHELKSDDEGSFEVSNLAVGSYSISVEAAGFTSSLESVEVKSGAVAEENVQLGISVAQVVNVFANDNTVPTSNR